MELLKTNVKSRKIGEDVLLYGSCIRDEYPEVLKSFKQGTKFSVCLEEQHMDMVAWKVTSIVRNRNPEEISVLTIDGSPHCVQLHYIAEDVKEVFPSLAVKHYVIEKDELFEISSSAVKKSRHLKGVEDLLRWSQE
jgi:hypothetical protein